MGKSREEDRVRGVSRATQVHDFQMVSYAEAWRHMVSRGVGELEKVVANKVFDVFLPSHQ